MPRDDWERARIRDIQRREDSKQRYNKPKKRRKKTSVQNMTPEELEREATRLLSKKPKKRRKRKKKPSPKTSLVRVDSGLPYAERVRLLAEYRKRHGLES